MSRSGYVDDLCDPIINLYRGSVARAIRGKRGQKFLRELAVAMDAMPEKALIAERLAEGGDVCAIGSALVARGMSEEELNAIDYEDPDSVAEACGIARCLAAEIEYENDECGDRFEPLYGPPAELMRRRHASVRWQRIGETPEERWQRMRKWVSDHIND